MGTAHGITSNFIANYNALLNENKDEDISGYIKLANSDKSIMADIEVIIVMKTLLTTGITRNEYLATACRKFFLALLHTRDPYLTRKGALILLHSDSYEECCLYEAISSCFGDVNG